MDLSARIYHFIYISCLCWCTFFILLYIIFARILAVTFNEAKRAGKSENSGDDDTTCALCLLYFQCELLIERIVQQQQPLHHQQPPRLTVIISHRACRERRPHIIIIESNTSSASASSTFPFFRPSPDTTKFNDRHDTHSESQHNSRGTI